MKLLLAFSLFVFIQTGYTQTDTVVFYKANNKPANKSNAIRYVKIKSSKKGYFKVSKFTKTENKWIKSTSKETVYVTNDSTLKIVTIISENSNKETIRRYSKRDSLFYFLDYNERNQIKKEGLTKTILPLHLEGKIKEYYESGMISSIGVYKNNQMISNENWLENGERYIDNVFLDIDVMPKYPDGDLALRRHIAYNTQYPKLAKEKGIQGRVFIQFIVDEKGEMKNVCVARGVDPILDSEAKRVIEAIPKKWTIGMLDGKKVKVMFTVPINFQLN